MKTWMLMTVLLTGCYAEWDIPRTPRTDPCTRIREDKVVYIQPTCPNPPPRHPREPDPR